MERTVSRYTGSYLLDIQQNDLSQSAGALTEVPLPPFVRPSYMARRMALQVDKHYGLGYQIVCT